MGLLHFKGVKMAIIFYLLGCILMADILHDEDDEIKLVPWIISSMLWPLDALIALWYGMFRTSPHD